MSITIAPPPVSKAPVRKAPVQKPPPAAQRTAVPPPGVQKPRDPAALAELWPAGVLAPGDAEQLRQPYSRARGVSFEQSKCGTCVALLPLHRRRSGCADVPKDFDTLRWFLLHEHTQLFIEGRKWFLMFFTRCRELSAQNTCNIHPDRPSICREYSPTWCDRDEVERRTRLTHVFRTPEELDAWRDGWVKRYEARRRKARREARQKRARRMRGDAARAAKARLGQGAPEHGSPAAARRSGSPKRRS
jgi:Fe-S-cluster containining protein